MRRLFVEHDDHVDRLQRREDLGALRFGVDRTSLALVEPHRPIRIDAHDQRVAERLRLLEVPDVAGVQQIEDAVREDDPVSCPAERLGHAADLVSRDDRHGLRTSP